MDTLELAKILASQPTSVLLLAALILVFTLWRKDAAQFRTDLAEKDAHIEEHVERYQALLREALSTLTRVGDILK